jgi:malonyl CoA-acyl carrier protein transacylase
MTKRIAILFAGQGAQAVGMGKDLAEKYAGGAGSVCGSRSDPWPRIEPGDI